jgi:hypothetical protein
METDPNHVADLRVKDQNKVEGVRSDIGHMEGDSRLGTAQHGGY